MVEFYQGGYSANGDTRLVLPHPVLFRAYLALLGVGRVWGGATRVVVGIGTKRKKVSLSYVILSVFEGVGEGKQFPPGKFDTSAHVQAVFLVPGDSSPKGGGQICSEQYRV